MKQEMEKQIRQEAELKYPLLIKITHSGKAITEVKHYDNSGVYIKRQAFEEGAKRGYELAMQEKDELSNTQMIEKLQTIRKLI